MKFKLAMLTVVTAIVGFTTLALIVVSLLLMYSPTSNGVRAMGCLVAIPACVIALRVCGWARECETLKWKIENLCNF